MKLINKNQYGFSPVVIIVAVIGICVVALLGYVAYDRFIVSSDSAVVEQSAVADDMTIITSAVPEKVVDTSGLDEAITVLDQVTESQTTEDTDLVTQQVAEF